MGECINCGESGNWCRCDEPEEPEKDKSKLSQLLGQRVVVNWQFGVGCDIDGILEYREGRWEVNGLVFSDERVDSVVYSRIILKTQECKY